MANRPSTKQTADRTANARDEKRNQKITDAGGAAVLARFKTASELEGLDMLVAAGVGKSRPDVILNLVAERAAQIKSQS